jgi:hypothetical protein
MPKFDHSFIEKLVLQIHKYVARWVWLINIYSLTWESVGRIVIYFNIEIRTEMCSKNIYKYLCKNLYFLVLKINVKIIKLATDKWSLLYKRVGADVRWAKGQLSPWILKNSVFR